MELRYSVIIPARNARPELAGILTALSAEAEEPTPQEVVVVDDGSIDSTADLARASGARVISLPGRGPAAARNAGASAASGDLLVFFDADCVPEQGCLDALLAPFDDPRVAGVRGAYTTDQRALVARFVQLEMEEKQQRMAASRETAVIDTACAAYRRRVFLDGGGFDERLPATSVEDVELSFRLVAQGARLIYAPGARVRHRHTESLAAYLRRKLRFGYYRARLYRRYPARMGRDGYTPRLMPIQIGLAGLLAAGIIVGPWYPISLLVTTATALAFLGTALPLTRRAWSVDPHLAVFVPALLLARSLAQGLGFLVGAGSLAVGAWRR